MTKPPKPEPMICPACDEVYEFQWNKLNSEWDLETQWWTDPQDSNGWNFTCSIECYISRFNERCDPSRGTHSTPHRGPCILR